MTKLLDWAFTCLSWGLWIGSPAGIPIYLHWSLFPVLLLIDLAQGMELCGIYAMLLGSVLCHEWGHCAVARRFRWKVHCITLSPIGGLASMRIDLPPPREEVMVAFAGPLVSLIFAVAGIGTFLVSGMHLAWHLAVMNWCIFLFNLLPIFPMDGGRLLRAYCHHRSGNIIGATFEVWPTSFIGCISMGLIGFYCLAPALVFAGAILLMMSSVEVRHTIDLEHERRRKAREKELEDLGRRFGAAFLAELRA